MGQMRELAAGESTRLPEDVLRASLIGFIEGVDLGAFDADGNDVIFRRINSHTVLVRSGRDVHLLATPLLDGVFAAGTRIGVDIRVEGSAFEPLQVLVQPVDVGALGQYEVARLEPTPGGGWTMTATAVRPESDSNQPFASRADDPRGRRLSGVDERQVPWIAAGRYAFRGSRGGRPPAQATDVPWALVMDASLSMRAAADAEQLAALVELVAGILAAWTGRLPEGAMATGLTRPEPDEAAVERPASLVESVLDEPRPPSWNMVTPATSECSGLGAKMVAIVTDGAPADLRDLEAYLAERSDIHVFLIAISPSKHGSPTHSNPAVAELGALANVGSVRNLTVVAVNELTAGETADAVQVAAAMTGVA